MNLNYYLLTNTILFKDLVNFDDPLNIDAANMYQSNKETFIRKVKEYITRYCCKLK